MRYFTAAQRWITGFVVFSGIALGGFCSGAELVLFNPLNEYTDVLDEVWQKFQDPPAAFRPAPLMVWNDVMTEAELEKQLDEFKEQGFGGVFVHPRPGLVTPYLSERWLELWRFTVDECRKRDMVTYIYDENSYPSGFAGGHVPEEMPESRGTAINVSTIEADAVNEMALSKDTVALFRITDDSFEKIDLPEISGETIRTGRELNLPAGVYLRYDLTYANKRDWLGGRFYTDLLRPGVAEKFLDITLGAYDTVLRDEYGRHVLACFTDEPESKGANGMSWTPSLPDVFLERHGYHIEDHLPSLNHEIGNWRQVRHDYTETVLWLFIVNWAKPYYEACEKRGILSTGHIWEHGWPGAGIGPDTMSYNAWQHAPGIDTLMNQYNEGPHAQFGNYRAMKEIDSIANQFGRSRKLCEAYGAGGWELTLQDMKRIGDWLHVGGINLFNPHLSYVTIRGARKRDHPQSFSYHAPWWEAYHISTNYFSRLSWALAMGEEKNDILVIEPTTTGWMYNWGEGTKAQLDKLGADFQAYITELAAAQIDFDLASEPVVGAIGSVKGARFVVGNRDYGTVIFPPGLENVESDTGPLYNEFVANGGRLVGASGLPKYVGGKEISDEVLKKFLKTAGDNWITEPVTPELAEKWSNADVRIRATDVKDGRIYHYLRTFEDGYLLFVVNTSLEETSTGFVTARAASVQEWDPADGSSRNVALVENLTSPKGKNVDPSICWRFYLPPAGSALFAIRSNASSQTPSRIVNEYKETDIAPLGAFSIKNEKPNVLPLDYVNLTLNGETTNGLYFYDAQTRIYQAYGFSKNPWDSAVQYKDEILQKDHFPADSGFELQYPFTIRGFKQMPKLELVVERGDRYTVSINGRVLDLEEGRSWLDRSFYVYPIAPKDLKAGLNIISTKAQPFSVHHEPEPVYVLGNFNLKSAEKGWDIVPATSLKFGNWNAQGRPCYPGKVSYAARFVINKPGTETFVELDDWTGTVARVDVNGQFAGYIGWQPWRLDIKDHLRSGKNTISVAVIGSLKNLLGPHHNGPARGSAWPGMFHKHPEGGQPSGDDYDVIGYGLRKPFRVYQRQADN